MSTILSLRSRFFVRGDVGQKSGCRICVGFRRTASLPNDTDAVINGGDGIGRPEKELVAASLQSPAREESRSRAGTLKRGDITCSRQSGTCSRQSGTCSRHRSRVARNGHNRSKVNADDERGVQTEAIPVGNDCGVCPMPLTFASDSRIVRRL